MSLTRQALNPLMWAHYGDEHKGMVIGIDASIELFTCEKGSLVPVQFGSVMYTGIKPDAPLFGEPTEEIEVGGTFHFPRGQLEQLQRIFLFKPGCWAYEEEVRIAKCLKGVESGKPSKSGTFDIIEVNKRPLYLLRLPQNVIKEVYIGARSESLDAKRALDLIKEIHLTQPRAKVYGCRISRSSWSLERFDLQKKSEIALENQINS